MFSAAPTTACSQPPALVASHDLSASLSYALISRCDSSNPVFGAMQAILSHAHVRCALDDICAWLVGKNGRDSVRDFSVEHRQESYGPRRVRASRIDLDCRFLSTDFLIVFSDDLVAFAGGFVQTISIGNGHPTPFHMEDSSPFECRHHHAHRRPVRSQ
jgi:hypothetical protein